MAEVVAEVGLLDVGELDVVGGEVCPSPAELVDVGYGECHVTGAGPGEPHSERAAALFGIAKAPGVVRSTALASVRVGRAGSRRKYSPAPAGEC